MKYEELTYKIIGSGYKVFNNIGILINFGPSGVEVKRKFQKPNQNIKFSFAGGD